MVHASEKLVLLFGDLHTRSCSDFVMAGGGEELGFADGALEISYVCQYTDV